MKHLEIALWILLGSLSWGQVPQGVTASMYEPTAPGLMAYINWQPVVGATEYNIYKEMVGLGTCPNAFPAEPEDTVTDTFYIDNPNSGWYQMKVTDDWRQRLWCYAVTAVVNGQESAKSKSAFVAIGDSGYLTLEYRNPCTGPKVVPFPYMQNQIVAHFYYTGSDGVSHEIPTIHLYNAYPYPEGDPIHAYNEEWEWKIPVIATDGTVVPWDQNGKYTYTIRTPDGGYTSDWFTPRFQLDASYYNQRTLFRVQNNAYNDWCPINDGPGGNYSYWQNVTR